MKLPAKHLDEFLSDLRMMHGAFAEIKGVKRKQLNALRFTPDDRGNYGIELRPIEKTKGK